MTLQSIPKIHLIGFMTQGPPYDEGEDLTKTSAFIKHAAAYKKGVDTFTVYTTESASRLFPDFKRYTQSIPEYDYREHSSGSKHGFWKWKPYLILQHLKTIPDGDILVYHDTNTSRYKEYGIDVGSMRENTLSLFKDKTSVIAAIQDIAIPNASFTRPELFHQLRTTEEGIQCGAMRCNRIFIKKDKLSVNFVENWLKLCETSLLLPDPNEKYTDERPYWHTHDQAIFNVLYQKYVEMKLFKKPTLYFKNQIFSKEMIEYTDRVPKKTILQKPRSFMRFV